MNFLKGLIGYGTIQNQHPSFQNSLKQFRGVGTFTTTVDGKPLQWSIDNQPNRLCNHRNTGSRSVAQHFDFNQVKSARGETVQWTQLSSSAFKGRRIHALEMGMDKASVFCDLLAAMLATDLEKPKIDPALTRKYFQCLDSAPNYEEDMEEVVSKALLRMAEFESTKMVNSCKLYKATKQGTLQLQQAYSILLVKEQPKYCFYCYVVMPGADLQSKEQLCEGTEVLSFFPITSSLNFECSKAGNYFKYFDCYGAQPVIRVLQFDGYGVSLQLSLMISRCCWEARNYASFDKAIDKSDKSEDQLSEYDYPEVNEQEEIASLAAGIQNLKVVETVVVKEAYRELESASEEKYRDFRAISQLKKLDVSLITNGPVVEVYTEHKEEFKKLTNLKEIKDKQGRTVVPSKILPLKGQTRAFLLDPQRPSAGYYLDINKECLIADFQKVTKQDIVSITHKNKNDQFDEVEVFYGITPQGIYMFDPRVDSCVGFKKQYKTSTAFSAIGSTGDGNFAVGSQTGDIRLYKEAGQEAKNNYSMKQGDPVRHIQCSSHGSLVLATYDNYLVIIPSADQDMGDAFRQKIPKARRQAPRKLKLRPEDFCKIKAKDAKFTKAKFDQEEKLVIAGLGELMVVWDLLQVLKGRVNSYKLLDGDDRLRECQFMMNDPSKLIVVSDNKVRLQQFAH